MSEVKHMPLPWRKHDRMDYAEILCADGSSAPVIAMVAKADDADLIVQAVNSHYALIEALERALNFIANTEGEMGETLPCGELARSALSLAKGEQ